MRPDLTIMLEKELLNLKGSKLGQILSADKTGFCRFGHILSALYAYLFLVHS